MIILAAASFSLLVAKAASSGLNASNSFNISFSLPIPTPATPDITLNRLPLNKPDPAPSTDD